MHFSGAVRGSNCRDPSTSLGMTEREKKGNRFAEVLRLRSGRQTGEKKSIASREAPFDFAQDDRRGTAEKMGGAETAPK